MAMEMPYGQISINHNAGSQSVVIDWMRHNPKRELGCHEYRVATTGNRRYSARDGFILMRI